MVVDSDLCTKGLNIACGHVGNFIDGQRILWNRTMATRGKATGLELRVGVCISLCIEARIICFSC